MKRMASPVIRRNLDTELAAYRAERRLERAGRPVDYDLTIPHHRCARCKRVKSQHHFRTPRGTMADICAHCHGIKRGQWKQAVDAKRAAKAQRRQARAPG